MLRSSPLSSSSSRQAFPPSLAPISGVLISHLQIYNKSTTFGLYFLPKYIPKLHLHIFCLFATTFYHCATPTKVPAVIPRPASATTLRRRCAHPRNRLTHNDLRHPDQASRKRPPFTPPKAAFHPAKNHLSESKRPPFAITQAVAYVIPDLIREPVVCRHVVITNLIREPVVCRHVVITNLIWDQTNIPSLNPGSRICHPELDLGSR